MALLTALDTGFLRLESPETPMHVGALEIFLPPPEEEATFARDVAKAFSRRPRAKPPFSLRLADTPWRSLLPAWEETGRIDLDYHLRRWALPSPGGRRELDDLVSYLHTERLDRSRPLWQMHLIEGLPGGRLAIYTKVHHALLDGVGGARLLQSVLSEDCDRCNLPPPWAPLGRRRRKKRGPPERHGFSDLGHLLDLAAVRMRTLPGLYGTISGLTKATLGNSLTPLTGPFKDVKTLFNGKIGGDRRCSFRTLDLERMRKTAHRTDATVNDVFLAICGGALRRYLEERHALPDKPLTAMVPVSIRPDGDDSHGNAVSFVLATLATDIAEPCERLAAVRRSTLAAKENLRQLSATGISEYTLLLALPLILLMLTGLGGVGRPPFNLIVSNVPGPGHPLYFNGALLEAIYPLSIVTHGQALNITGLSYAGEMHVGFTACDHAVPRSHRLATYTEDALVELEAALAPKPRPYPL